MKNKHLFCTFWCRVAQTNRISLTSTSASEKDAREVQNAKCIFFLYYLHRSSVGIVGIIVQLFIIVGEDSLMLGTKQMYIFS